ncbi:MAG: hypothetical protein KY468_15565 [Armatimonadetes bacterium]|nr:hypothetical protein [Armatimonadota bacterium]
MDSADNLYVADTLYNRIQRRDRGGNWTVAAPRGASLGQVERPVNVCVDRADQLYVQSAGPEGSRIQKRDAAGNWTELPPDTPMPCPLVEEPVAEISDRAGNRYFLGRITDSNRFSDYGVIRQDPQGNMTLIAPSAEIPDPPKLGEIKGGIDLLIDPQDRLHILDNMGSISRIQRREHDGSWTQIAFTETGEIGPLVEWAEIDRFGNLYVYETLNTGTGPTVLKKRDPQGNWTTLLGPALQGIRDLEVDSRGTLFALSASGSRILALIAADGSLRGDLNDDGSLTVQDAILCLQVALEIQPLQARPTGIGDMDGDGRLTVGDAVLILKRVVGL